MITSHTLCYADNWRVPLVLWLNTTAASASDTPSHSPPLEQTGWCSSPGIWTLLKPFKHRQKGERVTWLYSRKGLTSGSCSSGLTTALQDAISLTRSITSWLNVVGQKTCDTRPRLHASCAVSFLPQNSISLACHMGQKKGTIKNVFFSHYVTNLKIWKRKIIREIWLD